MNGSNVFAAMMDIVNARGDTERTQALAKYRLAIQPPSLLKRLQQFLGL